MIEGFKKVLLKGSIFIFITASIQIQGIAQEDSEVQPRKNDTTITESNEASPDDMSADSTFEIHQQDTLPVSSEDTVITEEKGDTIPSAERDTLEDRTVEDTTRQQVTHDTVRVETVEDTLTVVDPTIILPETTEYVPKTKTDSAILYWEQYAFQDTASVLTDSVQKNLEKFFSYAKAHPVDSTLDFVRNFLKTDSIPHIYKDSTRLSVNDSLYNYLNYLWNKTKKDSLTLTVYNDANDSSKIWLARDSEDSSRFMI